MEPSSFKNSGPIYLDELFCTDMDETIQECQRGIRAIGLTTCTHLEDIWIQCNGLQECNSYFTDS